MNNDLVFRWRRAAELGDVGVLKKMLPHVQWPDDRNMALRQASMYGCVEAVEFLLSHANPTDRLCAAFRYAVVYGHAPVVEVLMPLCKSYFFQNELNLEQFYEIVRESMERGNLSTVQALLPWIAQHPQNTYFLVRACLLDDKREAFVDALFKVCDARRALSNALNHNHPGTQYLQGKWDHHCAQQQRQTLMTSVPTASSFSLKRKI